MQEDFRLIVDLVLVLAAAAAGGLFASLLRQPVILGYLLGGIVVGPAGLGLIKELIQVDTLAEFGVAFLLFALGVEFSFAELNRVKAISLGGGGLQIVLTIATTAISLAVGWAESQSGASPSQICKFHQEFYSDAPYKLCNHRRMRHRLKSTKNINISQRRTN